MEFVHEQYKKHISIYAGLLGFNASLLLHIVTKLLPNILCNI